MALDLGRLLDLGDELPREGAVRVIVALVKLFEYVTASYAVCVELATAPPNKSDGIELSGVCNVHVTLPTAS